MRDTTGDDHIFGSDGRCNRCLKTRGEIAVSGAACVAPAHVGKPYPDGPQHGSMGDASKLIGPKPAECGGPGGPVSTLGPVKQTSGPHQSHSGRMLTHRARAAATADTEREAAITRLPGETAREAVLRYAGGRPVPGDTLSDERLVSVLTGATKRAAKIAENLAAAAARSWHDTVPQIRRDIDAARFSDNQEVTIDYTALAIEAGGLPVKPDDVAYGKPLRGNGGCFIVADRLVHGLVFKVRVPVVWNETIGRYHTANGYIVDYLQVQIDIPDVGPPQPTGSVGFAGHLEKLRREICQRIAGPTAHVGTGGYHEATEPVSKGMALEYVAEDTGGNPKRVKPYAGGVMAGFAGTNGGPGIDVFVVKDTR